MATSKLLLTFAICRLIVTVGLTLDPTELLLLGVDGQLSVDPSDVETASLDFGLLTRAAPPLAVLHPASAQDIAQLIKAAYGSDFGFTVSARGHGHSINGQAQTANGVVVQMSGSKRGSGRKPPQPRVWPREKYVDVWGGELWIDVLRSSLEYGLAPKSWTDYLYLSVGGTLSNAGISGQAFNHGPQISNVHELDVVTGKGELLTCSEEQNSELFHAVLGGLGQFGIITRARISLEPAPQRVRWIRVLYSNFSAFTRDQEYLISLHGEAGSQKFDYVEGFVIADEGLINNWRSSFFSPRNPVKISSLEPNGGVLYCLEITKNYHESTASTIDKVRSRVIVEEIGFYTGNGLYNRSAVCGFLGPGPQGGAEAPIQGVVGGSAPMAKPFCPQIKDRWDCRSSVVTPDEDVFYLVALLRSALDNGEETHSLEYLTNQNRQILKFCDDAGINVKQYLPHYTTHEEWMDHFGNNWDRFYQMKMEFDPRHILASGQQIFTPTFRSSSKMVASW
ncbi:hypothetical protein V6N13_120254 [Hibiscus sabdariffa]